MCYESQRETKNTSATCHILRIGGRWNKSFDIINIYSRSDVLFLHSLSLDSQCGN